MLLDVRYLCSAQRDVETLTQLEHNLVLQRENVANPAVELDGAAHLAGFHVDEVGGDSHQLADALETADDDPRRAETAADVDGERLVEVGARRKIAQGIEHARAADDRQAVDVL